MTVTPNFYFISETSKSLSVNSKSLKKIYRVENVRANVLKYFVLTVKTGEVYVHLLPVMEIYKPKCYNYAISLFKLPLFKWALSENLHFDSIGVWLNTPSCWQCHTSKAMCYFFLHKCEGYGMHINKLANLFLPLPILSTSTCLVSLVFVTGVKFEWLSQIENKAWCVVVLNNYW